MEFSEQEYWHGLPFPPPGDHPNLGIEPTSLVSPTLAGRFFTIVPPGSPTSYPHPLPTHVPSLSASLGSLTAPNGPNVPYEPLQPLASLASQAVTSEGSSPPPPPQLQDARKQSL